MGLSTTVIIWWIHNCHLFELIFFPPARGSGPRKKTFPGRKEMKSHTEKIKEKWKETVRRWWKSPWQSIIKGVHFVSGCLNPRKNKKKNWNTHTSGNEEEKEVWEHLPLLGRRYQQRRGWASRWLPLWQWRHCSGPWRCSEAGCWRALTPLLQPLQRLHPASLDRRPLTKPRPSRRRPTRQTKDDEIFAPSSLAIEFQSELMSGLFKQSCSLLHFWSVDLPSKQFSSSSYSGSFHHDEQHLET